MSEKRKCCEKIWPRGSWSRQPCMSPAKHEINGLWYCGTHNPEAIARRKAREEAQYQAKLKVDQEIRARKNFDLRAGNACRALGIDEPEKLLTEWQRKEAR